MGVGINHGYKHVQRSFVLQGGMRCVRSHEQQMCERDDLFATDIGITAVLMPSEMGLGINQGHENQSRVQGRSVLVNGCKEGQCACAP